MCTLRDSQTGPHKEGQKFMTFDKKGVDYQAIEAHASTDWAPLHSRKLLLLAELCGLNTHPCSISAQLSDLN